MEKVQKKFDEVHALVCKELEDPELEPVLRAAFLAIKKDLEAVADALGILRVQAISNETREVNARIEADWRNPEVQVDPNGPHVFAVDEPEPEPAAEPALD